MQARWAALPIAVVLVAGCSTGAPSAPPRTSPPTPTISRASTPAAPSRLLPERAVEMHARRDPQPGSDSSRGAVTYGRGDLNGDGQPDLVVVRSTGRVSARISGVGRRTLRVVGDHTLRLQALPALTGDGRADILLGSTAAGCCGVYHLPDTHSAVLRLWHGRLRQVRWVTGRPLTLTFDAGRGDLYAGIRCGRAELRQVRVLRGATRAHVRAITIEGRTATVRHVGNGSVPVGLVAKRAATRCPGMTKDGWAD